MLSLVQNFMPHHSNLLLKRLQSALLAGHLSRNRIYLFLKLGHLLLLRRDRCLVQMLSFERDFRLERIIFPFQLVDDILLAVGRQANKEGLGLEAAGVETHKRGITVNDRLQTTNPNIYAVGDVASKYQFTHTADEMARIVIQNALFYGRRKFSDVIVPWVTFTDPEVAHVGMYPADAEAAGIQIDTFTTQIAEIDRGRADGESGFVKIHVKRGSDKIVGATIVAKHAGEIIGEIGVAMRAGAGMNVLRQTVHAYPTTAEAIRKTADAWNRTRLTPTVAGIFNRWMRWTR